MFSWIFDKSESSIVSRECYYDIIPCRCQEGNHLTILFWINSKFWKCLKNFIAVFCLSKKIKNIRMRSPLPTLRANTIFTKERQKPALPNALIPNGTYFSLTSWYKRKVEEFGGKKRAEFEVRRQNLKIECEEKTVLICFTVGRGVQVGNLVFGTGLEYCKLRFEPISFVFFASLSMIVICGNRRISNAFIS